METGNWYTVVVLGTQGLDKSALYTMLIQSNFVDQDPIEGHYTKTLLTEEGSAYHLDILDSVGATHPVCNEYIKRGHGFIIMYDSTDLTSTAAAIKYRDHIYKRKKSKRVPVKLVGNKGEDRTPVMEDCISRKKGRYALMESLHLDANVTMMFHELVEAMDNSRYNMQEKTKACSIM